MNIVVRCSWEEESVLLQVLKVCLEEAKRDARQGNGYLSCHSAPRDDQRTICLDHVIATTDKIPELLCDHAEQFRAISQVRFEQEMDNLGERVGIDFFPETSTEFVWRLLRNLVGTKSDHFALRGFHRPRSEIRYPVL
ncbi:hypothetical protein E0H22_14260 [Rhodopseudomonas boonkerdii]|uniref:hypothetical protein n=1 Tax=Rhodopseudomonas boonkerdii TaxID=475937 RepID=UPI001E40669E|nr:hypothetical protein [Rhodopseudomonas boonkerdii]UGV26740.1 hypothetical protein E0H22_14260 [Rhodopseudomonas boonkerdii]